jgi:hypothetical protein
VTRAIDLAERFGLWLVWYLAPLKQNIATVLALVAVDVVTGVWASFKKGTKFESKTLRKTVSKSIGYLTFIVLGLLVEPYAPDSIPLVKIITGFVVWTEFQSIVMENLSVITGIDLWAAFRGKAPKDGK